MCRLSTQLVGVVRRLARATGVVRGKQMQDECTRYHVVLEMLTHVAQCGSHTDAVLHAGYISYTNMLWVLPALTVMC